MLIILKGVKVKIAFNIKYIAIKKEDKMISDIEKDTELIKIR
ncbi:hypothetical protein [Mycoplasmopsis pullorum]|nr:hypothetical protein [Mycoplasmopsis pullorum]